jgi:hypothetical protein
VAIYFFLIIKAILRIIVGLFRQPLRKKINFMSRLEKSNIIIMDGAEDISA